MTAGSCHHCQMPSLTRTHVLFDFFGTLVSYSASRTDQGYAASHELARRFGAQLSYPDFLDAWDQISARFDAQADEDGIEFSMLQLASDFLTSVLGRVPSVDESEAFVDTYVGEWNQGVRYLDGVTGLLDELRRDYRLAVVTNTHLASLVPGHLRAMGVADRFDAVITSVEVGWRKPHPAIYAVTLTRLGIPAGAAAFVGDTFAADYDGPEQAGMQAFLIDPDGLDPVPKARRLSSVLDLPRALEAA